MDAGALPVGVFIASSNREGAQATYAFSITIRYCKEGEAVQ